MALLQRPGSGGSEGLGAFCEILFSSNGLVPEGGRGLPWYLQIPQGLQGLVKDARFINLKVRLGIDIYRLYGLAGHGKKFLNDVSQSCPLVSSGLMR